MVAVMAGLLVVVLRQRRRHRGCQRRHRPGPRRPGRQAGLRRRGGRHQRLPGQPEHRHQLLGASAPPRGPCPGEPEGRDQRQPQVARRAGLDELRVLDRADPARRATTACDPNDPVELDGRRGQHHDPLHRPGQEQRPRIRHGQRVTFRRAGFLDFLYYTDLENQDPYLPAAHHVGARQPRHRHQRQPDRRSRRWPPGRPTSASATGGAPRPTRARGGRRSPVAGPVPDLVGLLRRRGFRRRSPTTRSTPTTSAARSPS